MPSLPTQKTIKVVLPSTEGSKDPGFVILKENILVGEIMDIDFDAVKRGEISSVKLGIKLLVKLITEWNFTDEHDKVIPVTLDNIKRMEINDIIYLLNKVDLPDAEQLDEEKKSD